MKKKQYPDNFDEWARDYFGIVNESVSDYLIRNGYTSRTPEARIKAWKMSLAHISPHLTDYTRLAIEEIKSIMDAYEHAYKTRELTDVDAQLIEKTQYLWDSATKLPDLIAAAHSNKKYRQKQSERASKPRGGLTEDKHRRIVRLYLEGKENGEGYGLVKRLASTYEVSTTTIHTIVKKHKPKSIDK